MNKHNYLTPGRRLGFTLVELLVVLAFMLVLAALAVAFVPKATERARANRGADLLQQWIVTARQWAKKDRVPTGIRLQRLPSAGSPNAMFVTDLQYIQQPDDFRAPGTSVGPPPTVGTYPPNSVMVYPSPAPPVVTVDLYGGYPSNPTLWPVQPGDYLEIQGGGLLHQITGVSVDSNVSPTPTTANVLVLASNPYASSTTPPPAALQYRIIRAPRLVAGEQPLQLPQDVAIDLNLSRLAATDILFSPSGSVLGQNAATDKIILWVRDVTQDGIQGGQTLMTIFTRTGFVAAHQVDTSVKSISTTSVVRGNGTPPGSGVPITVTNAFGIGVGTALVLDDGGAVPEMQTVTTVSGNIITVGQVNYPHTAAFSIIVDPYSFTRDARPSGL